MTIYIYKGDDLLTVDESVMGSLIAMGAIEYADNSDRGMGVDVRGDSIKYDLKITITKCRRKEKEK